MVNKYFEEVKLHSHGVSQEDGRDERKWYYIVPAVSLSVLLLVIIILIIKRCLRKQRQAEESSVYTIPVSDDQISLDHIYQPVYKNHRNPVYLVPFSALPENFDFSRPDIIVRGDYIIIKDLLMLEQPVLRPPSVPTTPTTPTVPIYYLEEYKKQQPYNPNFY